MTNAQTLLAEYVRTGSEPAFRELVTRYVDLVYSTALRRVGGDSHLAQDVAQTVFLRLSRKAGRLSGEVSLGGWLHRDTCYVAATVMRSEYRRQARERQAAEMNALQDHSEANLSQILPVLDEAINELGIEDRAAIMLRFFEQYDFRSVGASLGSSEDAARMRVNRALEKLQGLLRNRGVALSATGLATILGTQVLAAAPVGLATGIAGAVLGGAAATTGGLPWLQTILAKWKLVALSGAALVAILGISLQYGYRPGANSSPPQTPPPASVPSVQSQPEIPDAAATTMSLPGEATKAPVSHMNFLVVDAETGTPLSNAKLRVNYFREGGNMDGVKLSTDAQGTAQIELPQKPYRSMNVFVTSDGHVPKVVDWPGSSPEYPADYCMKVEAGTTVGGRVVDEDQQPVADAAVKFQGHGIDRTKKENIQFSSDTTQHTDAGGYWSCNMIPAHYEGIAVVLTHPDFATTPTNIPANTPEALNTVLVIRRGVTVAGTVEDMNGQPIAGASVRQVHNRAEPKLSAETDNAGRFEFHHLRPGELQIAVQAGGFSPAVLETNVSVTPVELVFHLGAGHLLRGRVVDEDGTPITNALARTDSDSRGLRKVEWSARTDAQGRFVWDSAPEEALLYWFDAEGFNWSRGLRLKADGTEHEITLQSKTSATASTSTRVTGTAADEETGQPLDEFKVLIGEIRIPDSAPEFSFGTDGKDGKFSLSLDSPHLFQTYQIQIQKDGYVPVASANLLVEDGNQTLAFKLRKGSGPSGIVVLPNGEPAVNATVFLYEARGGVYMDKPGQVRKEQGITTENRVQTDELGRFSFAPKLLGRGLIAIHDLGYAEVTMAAFAGSIQLQPWGRVEGRLLNGHRPDGGEQILLGNFHYRYAQYGENGRQFPALSLVLEATTGADGNFVFEKVPPGERMISQRLTIPGQQEGFVPETQKQRVVVAAGTVTRVDLGGAGRMVAGRAVLPGATNAIVWQKVVVQLGLKQPGGPGPRPNRKDFASAEEFWAADNAYVAADRAFWASESGRAMQQAQRNYAALCKPDGSFLLPDIPAGNYQLWICVTQPKPRSAGPSSFPFESQEVGSLSMEVAVPDIAEDPADHPVDLGTLELKMAGAR